MAHVKYCYRCGRRASPDQPDCWYCGTTVRRTLRPERRCPYCDEIVREKAIKCANCGEFLDQAAELEKEDRTGDRRVQAEGRSSGRERPREDRTIRTVDPGKAIDHKTRLKLEAPTAHRLEKPARDPDAGATAESPTVPESILKGRAKSKDLARIERGDRDMATVEVEVEPAGPPAKRDASRDMAIPADVNYEGGARRGGFFDRLKGMFGGAAPQQPPQMQLREHSRFRVCAICQTEILATDNYCFHCGQKYAAQPFRFATDVSAPLNLGVYAVAAILLIPHVLYFVVSSKPPGWLLLVSGIGVMGVLGYSATNSIDRRNRTLSWVLLAVALAVMAVPAFLEYGPE